MPDEENKQKWSVEFGCEEWQNTIEYEDEFNARFAFVDIQGNPPTDGLYTCDYAILRNEAGDTVDSFQNKEGSDG